MKIAIIGNYPLDENCIFGGVEASVFGLAEEISKNHEVFVIDMPRRNGGDGVFKVGNIIVSRYENRGHRNASALCRVDDIIDRVEEINPDICHIHGTSVLCNRLYDELKAKGRKTLVTIHGLAHVEKAKALKNHFSLKTWTQFLYQRKAELDLLSKCQMALVDTAYVKAVVEGCVHSDNVRRIPRVEVVPQGIASCFFERRCHSDSKIILSVGAFSPRKGQLKLIEAYELMAKQSNDIELFVAGVVSDVKYFEAVKNKALSSNWSDRIHLCPNLEKTALLELYSKARVFALFSQEESQGIVFAEAMAVGLPVVATSVGGVPFVVCNGSGILVEYFDVASFAKALFMLMCDDEKWMAMSKSCRELANQYRWSEVAKSVLKYYKELL